jgi:putative ABC transport system substrate-binding protein
MSRRIIGLILTLALSLLWAPLAAAAPQLAKIPRVGLLDYMPFWEPFVPGLRELGYVEGQNIALEYRPTEGQGDRLPDLAAELVRLNVDVIVTVSSTPATLAAKRATTTIPIVMVGVGDPLRTGLVPSLARPAGNLTGSSQLAPQVSGKRLELLKEAVPTASRVAFLRNPANPVQIHHFHDVQEAARILGLTLQPLEVRVSDDLDRAFAAIARERPDALLITGDSVHQLHVGRIIDFATNMRLPSMYQVPEHVIAGGLMSYGASLPELFRRGALYVDKILKGAKPDALPIEQPTTFELVINLNTAQALGLTIPPTLLFQADEVIR